MTTPEKPRSMDDPDAPPTEDELRGAQALRDALARGEAGGRDDESADTDSDAAFARALALAHQPRPIDPDEHRAILARALAAPGRARGADVPRSVPIASPTKMAGPSKRGGIVVRAAFGAAAAALSLAAAFVFLVQSSSSRRAAMPPAEYAAAPAPTHAPAHVSGLGPETSLAVARSTQPLFREPFQTTGGTSARIDRIARARASELRDNRFARWGLR